MVPMLPTGIGIRISIRLGIRINMYTNRTNNNPSALAIIGKGIDIVIGIGIGS